MRTFIAVELEKNILDTIGDFIFKTYREIDSNKISWVKKENLHITLKFLGEINEKQVEVVKSVLDSVVKNIKEFKIIIEGIGVFPKIDFPRVLWLGIKDGAQKISELANFIDNELSNKGFAKEQKEFVAHLTIARIKQVRRLSEIVNYVEKYKNQHFGSSKVNSITFFQSILKPEGPEYKPIVKIFLKHLTF
ncbi:MAG: RNA 2',3'-cyclic phosphodiesterase [Endomicrobia bacterium]|nr:RNA 2',3'-cyclic phosphodiesterase [Endomicrobiia bacterium]MDW8055296.1 RNA 2',3'-cyclic phosphodiesterase [Elusimicrobiota bacterium]